jgi:3-hydroxymyristoyl/3-hydroxydecanoyl-(acyl carrier protein) dehydratase
VCAATAAHASATVTFCIAVDHPALPGHFPGAPVVPGALLLAEALHRFEELTAEPLQWRGIDSAKFLRPVAPGVAITAALSMADLGRGKIEFYVAGTLVAHVTLLTAVAAGDQVHE